MTQATSLTMLTPFKGARTVAIPASITAKFSDNSFCAFPYINHLDTYMMFLDTDNFFWCYTTCEEI